MVGYWGDEGVMPRGSHLDAINGHAEARDKERREMIRQSLPVKLGDMIEGRRVVEAFWEWTHENGNRAMYRLEGEQKARYYMTNERKNITQPSDWWAAFEEQAKSEGLTLAAWLGEAAKAKLPPKVAKKLTERPPANRPPKAKD